MESHLTWTIETEGTETAIHIRGNIDAFSPLDELIKQIDGPTAFDLSEIHRVNSHGVQTWIRFINAIEDKGPHRLLRCSPAVVDQMHIIANFHGAADVVSVMGPYYCDRCDLEVPVEIAAAIEGDVPTASCPKCSQPMQLEDLPEKYLRWF